MASHDLRPTASRHRLRRWRAIFCLLALLTGLAAADRHAAAQEFEHYRLAAQEAGSRVYALGVGIASLVKLHVLPENAVDLDVTITSGFLESFVLIDRGEAQFGLLQANWEDLIGSDGMFRRSGRKHQVKSVATLWQQGGQSTRLVARSDVDEAIVYAITRTIFENLPFLRQIDGSLDEALLDQMTLDKDLPLHPGARRYYDEVAASPAFEQESDSQGARTFVVYFDLDRAVVTEEARATLDELETFAHGLDAPKVWIAGYTDTTGSADYNLDLAKRRADAVLAELRVRAVAARNLDLTAFGERSPWVVTADQVQEARNRRVEILVEPGRDSVVIGRAERPAAGGLQEGAARN